MSHPTDAPLHILHPEVRSYIDGLLPPADPLLAALDAQAQDRDFPLIGRASGRVLELMSRTIGARRVFEFGSGFGYSAYFFAHAVGPEGEVIGSECDAHELQAHTRIYGGHPLRERIRIEHGDAMEIFAQQDGVFDCILIDIHKSGYPAAIQAAIPRVRPGGLIFVDNVLWGGKVARPAAAEDLSTQALQAAGRQLFSDPRIRTDILPIGDGLSVSLRLP
jgi:predicted O-methyltransferase YrrM